MKNNFIRKLIAVEIKLGFLHIPAAGIEMMPAGNGRIEIAMPDGMAKLTYNAKYKRLFGLTQWYKRNKVKIGDEVEVEKNGAHYSVKFRARAKPVDSEKEAEKLIDISGLSSQAKGNIMEDRIKELIVLQGQGLLSVYRPVTDTHGIDLIVTKTGMYQPIFLQVKSRFNVRERGHFLMDVNRKTFTAHHSFYVLGASFDPQKMEVDENLLLVPSKEVEKGQIVNKGEKYRVVNRLALESKGRWSRCLIKKTDLASRLLEKFEEMKEYYT